MTQRPLIYGLDGAFGPANGAAKRGQDRLLGAGFEEKGPIRGKR